RRGGPDEWRTGLVEEPVGRCRRRAAGRRPRGRRTPRHRHRRAGRRADPGRAGQPARSLPLRSGRRAAHRPGPGGRPVPRHRDGPLLDPGPDAVPVAHALEIDTLARGTEGEPLLEATFSYAEGVFTEDEVRELARLWTEELTALVAATADGSAATYTPSDFPLV